MDTEPPGLADLVRARPVRTVVQSVVPLVLATAQGVNALVYGLPLLVAGAFAVVMVGFAVGSLRHSLAAFRTASLEAAHTGP